MKFLRIAIAILAEMQQNNDGITVALTFSEMKTQITTRGRRAFTLVELLVIIGVAVLLAIILLPAFYSPEIKAPRINCINNLKQDDLAFKMWADDNDGKYPMQISITDTNGGGAMEFAEKGIAFPIFQVMSNELNSPKILHCPADTKTFYATNFTTDFNNSNISYFVNLAASNDFPNSIFIGDDNFAFNDKPVSSGILNLNSNTPVEWSDERHHRAGNIAFADGSVSQMGNDQWRKLIETNVTLSRLVIP